MLDFWGHSIAASRLCMTGVGLCLALLAYMIVKGYFARKVVADLRAAGLPVAPGWSWVFGNLLLMGRMGHLVPSNATKVTIFGEIVRIFPQTGCCYIDLWPFSRPFLLVMHPELGAQACQTESLIAAEKPPELAEFFVPITGGLNLFDMPGKDWKPWRAVFNRGFSDSTVSQFVPGMVEEAVKYRDILVGLAKQEHRIIQLDPLTLRYSIDFIGRTALNSGLNSQRGYDELADSMLSQIRWMPKIQGANPFENLNLIRIGMQWWNSRTMDRYIGTLLDRRYHEMLQMRGQNQSSFSKSIMDLVLQAYISDHKTVSAPADLQPDFRAFAIRQVRLFVFAGHDSMSSTICYAIHLLSENPSALKQLREEHDSIFGLDIGENLATKISSNPSILNNLPYTNAVLKETLRLYPPGSATRQGTSHVSLKGPDGTRYPTEHCLVWVLHIAMHRAPEYWKRPDDFLPERWLKPHSEEGGQLAPMSHAWRPFEWGPRNCIGQNLALVELRITLAIIMRTLEFTPAYDEWNRLHKPSGLSAYRGDKAYQIEEAAAHPAAHYPCTIRLSERGRALWE